MKKKWNPNDDSPRADRVDVYRPKANQTISNLWRSVYMFGASFIFIIGGKYKAQTSHNKILVKNSLLPFP